MPSFVKVWKGAGAASPSFVNPRAMTDTHRLLDLRGILNTIQFNSIQYKHMVGFDLVDDSLCIIKQLTPFSPYTPPACPPT